MAVIGWIVLGPLAALGVTFLAGRLLGARRGWVSLAVAGIVGFTAGTVIAGVLTEWQWDSLEMVLVALVLSTLFTMGTALVLDLVAPVGSLHQGDSAGLVTARNPVAGLRTTTRSFRRYREVIGLARRNGVVGRPHRDELPAALRTTLEEAGGIFVKLGQIASTRTDVLPSSWCDELAQLRSAAKPTPEAQMRPVLTEEFGADPDEIFTSFDWTPIASASVSQVYQARLADGRDVVVKARRPGIDELVEVDTAAVMQLARLIERRTPLGLSVRPADLAREILDSVVAELDFRTEAQNAVELDPALRAVGNLRAPEMYEELSGRRMLTEERIVGDTVDQWIAGGPSDDERREVCERILQSFLHQIFTVGMFHADPHPGNIVVAADGSLILIDFGAVGRLSAGHRGSLAAMLVAASSGDAIALRRAVQEITVFDRRVEMSSLDEAIAEFLAEHMQAGKGITAASFQHLALMIGEFGIRLPRWFGTLTRTLVTLEGTLSGIDASFSLVDAAHEHAHQVAAPLASGPWREVVEREALAQAMQLRRIPGHVDEALEQLAAGRLTTRVAVFADPHEQRLLTRLVDRAVLALVASAVGIGSVLLLDVQAGPRLGSTISINEVLGYFGLTTSAVLVLRVVAGIIRDGEV